MSSKKKGKEKGAHPDPPPWYRLEGSNEGISFFQVLKSIAGQLSLGTDITRISLPSIFCYPITLLEIIAWKRLRGMEILETANSMKDPMERMMMVTRWFLSSLTADEFGKKPLNPIIGEVFEASVGEVSYTSQQVCHHPPVTAFHFENPTANASFWGQVRVEAKFGGNSVAANFVGEAYLKLRDHDELYVFNIPMPTMHARGLLMGTSRTELGGEIVMTCEKTGWVSNVNFKAQAMFSSEENEVSGKLKKSGEKKPAVQFEGRWDRTIKLAARDKSLADQLAKSEHWKGGVLFSADSVKCPSILVHKVDGKLNSRDVWEDVCAAIRRGDLALADQEKQAVEQEQRGLLEQIEKDGGFKSDYFSEKDGKWSVKEGVLKTASNPGGATYAADIDTPVEHRAPYIASVTSKPADGDDQKDTEKKDAGKKDENDQKAPDAAQD